MLGVLEDAFQRYSFLDSISFPPSVLYSFCSHLIRRVTGAEGVGAGEHSINFLPSGSWNPQSSSLVRCSVHQSGLGECN